MYREILYGDGSLVYNVHALFLHLPMDAARLGELDSFSVFPFENYLQELKGMVRMGKHVIEQLVYQIHLNDIEAAGQLFADK